MPWLVTTRLDFEKLANTILFWRSVQWISNNWNKCTHVPVDHQGKPFGE